VIFGTGEISARQNYPIPCILPSSNTGEGEGSTVVSDHHRDGARSLALPHSICAGCMPILAGIKMASVSDLIPDAVSK
jgi:hypothetical protein